VKPKAFSRKHLKRIIPLAIAGGLLLWFIVWATSPHQGKVAPSTAPETNEQALAPDKTLDSAYMTFQYSGKYLMKNEGPANNDLEVYRLNADTHYDKQIIASVSNLPDGQLGSYGNYIYRKIHTDLYGVRKERVAGTEVEVWVKNDGTEQTVMIPHGNVVATITFATASSSDQLTREVDALLSTFRWKK
jgi:hypothetical protein